MEKRIIELYRRKFDDIRHEADGIEYWYARESI
jgi:DNA-damage-inducible protein D